MLEDERDVTRTVEERDELDVMPKAVISQFLILRRRVRLRLHQRRRAFVLEVALETCALDVPRQRHGPIPFLCDAVRRRFHKLHVAKSDLLHLAFRYSAVA